MAPAGDLCLCRGATGWRSSAHDEPCDGRGAGAALPRDRPLREMHLVDGLDSGAAIYTRLQHALADGVELAK
ncbi:wax ester/triacylglycerol synthase domain-containing protein [Nocardioides islandensis]|uniref:wax ester/triacylglycerol synthase domain-containing protein n=1 Tax=Nocardioides islandensis TaxID=433663 RepID=UPI002B26C3D5|nr:wax ester/triacylglycerol synthase domain-containing protein [Nocardioides islandensis]